MSGMILTNKQIRRDSARELRALDHNPGLGPKTVARETETSSLAAARLAAEKSTSPDVKQFAQRIAAEHAQLSQIVAPRALQVDAAFTRCQSNAAQQRTVAQLQGLSGPDLDQQFIRSHIGELVFALRIYQSEIAASQDPA
jgi:predicted outer membrane protein